MRLIHQILVDACPPFYAQIVKKGHDLFAKKDAQFLQTVYKLLVRDFGVKPTLSIDQFFTSSFFEAKIDFSIECCELVRRNMPARKKPALKPQDRSARNEVKGVELPYKAGDRRQSGVSGDEEEEQHGGGKITHSTEYNDLQVSSHYEVKKKALDSSHHSDAPKDNSHSSDAPPKPTHVQIINPVQPSSRNYRSPEVMEDETLGYRADLGGKNGLQNGQVDEREVIIRNQRKMIEQLKSIIMTTNEVVWENNKAEPGKAHNKLQEFFRRDLPKTGVNRSESEDNRNSEHFQKRIING